MVTGSSYRGSAFGGKWRALAAGPGEALWALGNGAIVQLRPIPGTGREFMPHFDIPLGGIGNLTDLQMHGDWLLGLQEDGYLHAWSLTGESVHGYKLPQDVKWT